MALSATQGYQLVNVSPPFQAAKALPPQSAQTATNADAVMTLPAVTGKAWHMSSLRWSYSAAPTGGQIQIAWTDDTGNAAGSVTETLDVTAGGPGCFAFATPVRLGGQGSVVTITLKAGGAGIVGRIYATAWLRD